MEKVEHSVMEPVRNVDIEHTKSEFSMGMKVFLQKIEWFFIQKGLCSLRFGLSFGKGPDPVTFDTFCHAFFRRRLHGAKRPCSCRLMGLLAGAMTLSISNITYTFASSILFLILFRITRKFQKSELKAVPYFVFFTTIACQPCL